MKNLHPFSHCHPDNVLTDFSHTSSILADMKFYHFCINFSFLNNQQQMKIVHPFSRCHPDDILTDFSHTS